MAEATPVEAGQWREAWERGPIWAVVRPGRRKGFWVVASSAFPYDVWEEGRRILESMPTASKDYFGKGKPHPGIVFNTALGSASVDLSP
jgi:hypothetical protein